MPFPDRFSLRAESDVVELQLPQPHWSYDLFNFSESLALLPPMSPCDPNCGICSSGWDRSHPDAFVPPAGSQRKDLHHVRCIPSHVPFLGLCCIILVSPAVISMECDFKDASPWEWRWKGSGICSLSSLEVLLKEAPAPSRVVVFHGGLSLELMV